MIRIHNMLLAAALARLAAQLGEQAVTWQD